MGGLFTKPLSRDDLVAALKPINAKLEVLTDSLLAPDGDESAKDVTVAVFSAGATTVSCHGCITKLGKDVYLVSAAHAIVDLTYGGRYNIMQSVHPKNAVFNMVEFTQVYIPKSYIQHGTDDVGIAKLRFTSDLDQVGCEWRQFSVAGDREITGKTVVGHGRVFLRGNVLSYPDESRMMIGTASLPGCSGCPLFDNSKNLCAFVHGGVKHRGGRVLHNGGTDDATGYLYADSPKGVIFHEVHHDHYEILRKAEDISADLASQPDDAEVYRTEAPRALRDKFALATTLDEAMEALQNFVWRNISGDDARGVIRLTGDLTLLCHRKT